MKIVRYLLLVLFVLSCTSEKEEKEKINLLFIWTDQQRFDTMKAYGNDKIKVPNLNKLAEQCIVFEKAYVTQPVCTPSRSSVMTGLTPHTNGCYENNIPLKAETKTLPELINDPEYRTAYMGKWHLGDEVFAQHGFQEWYAIEDGYHSHYSKGKDNDKKARSSYHHWLISKGEKPNTEDGRFSRGFSSNLPVEYGKPKFLEEKAIEFMEENRANPFILYVNFLEPHSPFSSTLNEYHDLDNLTVPEDFSVDEELSYRDVMRKFSGDNTTTEKVPDFVRRYWGLMSKVDMSVGKILEKLYELGLDENTLIVYTSDHGEMLGSHGLKGKRYAFDESSRIPLLVKLPGTQKQRIIKEAVSQIDIVPSILDYLGYPVDESLEGKSLVDVWNGGEVKNNYVFFEMIKPKTVQDKVIDNVSSQMKISEQNLKKAIAASSRVVVSPDGWKMVVSNGDKSQLYNLNEDPLEYKNLYNDKQYADVIKRLSNKLLEWQKRTNDKLVLNF